MMVTVFFPSDFQQLQTAGEEEGCFVSPSAVQKKSGRCQCRWLVSMTMDSLKPECNSCFHDSSLFHLICRSDRMAQLLDERDFGVLTSSMSLLVALVANNHDAYWSCLPKCVKVLERMARNQDIPQEYTYYGIPSPWLQVCICFLLNIFSYIMHTKSQSSQDVRFKSPCKLAPFLAGQYHTQLLILRALLRGVTTRMLLLRKFRTLQVPICSFVWKAVGLGIIYQQSTESAVQALSSPFCSSEEEKTQRSSTLNDVNFNKYTSVLFPAMVSQNLCNFSLPVYCFGIVLSYSFCIFYCPCRFHASD